MEGSICSVSGGPGAPRTFRNRLSVYGGELCWDAKRRGRSASADPPGGTGDPGCRAAGAAEAAGGAIRVKPRANKNIEKRNVLKAPQSTLKLQSYLLRWYDWTLLAPTSNTFLEGMTGALGALVTVQFPCVSIRHLWGCRRPHASPITSCWGFRDRTPRCGVWGCSYPGTSVVKHAA